MVLMQVMAKVIVSLDQPFLLMGDFNMTPSEFSQGGFLEIVGGGCASC